MDKINKLLKKLSSKERGALLKVMENILSGKGLSEYNILKLKGRDDIYRIRVGKFRIIFRIDKKEDRFILSLERRSESTYNL